MKDSIYKLTELTGTSSVSMEDAVTKALKCAYESVKTLSWFQVVDTRGSIANGAVEQWQVTLKVGFKVDEVELPSPE
ncbi:MAG: dodecin [Verrucomicrobiota bacterium]